MNPTIKKIIIGLLILGAITVAGWVITALTSEAADLKCVTIKFKNDSELKLKTQWFVNGCDTTWGEEPWVTLSYDDSDLSRLLATMNPISPISIDTLFMGERRDLYKDRYKVFWGIEIVVSDVVCRTLLFSPDVRQEPVIKNGYYRYHADGHVTISDSLVVADTIPGEALLWYEEIR